MPDARRDAVVAEGSSRAGLRRAADWAIRLVLPVSVFAAVLGVLLGELSSIDHELQLVLPAAVRPGAPVPMQALLFGGLDGDAPPTLLPARVRVRVSTTSGRALAETTLAPSVAGGAAGRLVRLEVPEDEAAAPVIVEAVAFVGAEAVASLRTRLVVSPDAPPAPLVGRSARALQHFAPGPLQPIEGRLAPSPLAVRVRGGACVPETECALLVHVGAPAAAVRLVANAAVTPGVAPDEETEGLALLPFVVHGPEADVTLEATRGGEVVGQRDVRVPVALGTPGVRVPTPIAPDAPELEVDVLGDRPGVIVDVYREGHWLDTVAVPPSERPFTLPLAFPPGLARLQIRTDPFGSSHAAARYVVIAADGASEAQALEAALPAIGALGGDAHPPDGAPAHRLGWAAAPLEESARVLPRSVSGREADVARVVARQSQLRLAALIAIVLGLAVLALVVVRRGLDAALEAQRVMDETGDPALTSARHRRQTLLSALAIVATLLLAFLGAAIIVIARARLLG